MTAFTTVPFFAVPSGDASLTLAVMTSPSEARKPVPPPSGRIICNLRAPLLSATSSMVRIITDMFVSSKSLHRRALRLRSGCFRKSRHQGGLADDLDQAPALQLRQRPRLLDADDIADVG